MSDDRMNKAARAECLKVMGEAIDVEVAMNALHGIFKRDSAEDAQKVRIALYRIRDWVDRLEEAASTLDEEDA